MVTLSLAKVRTSRHASRLLTGSSADTFAENSTKYIDEIVAPLNDAGVKFSSTHGYATSLLLKPRSDLELRNHDNQINITHAQEIAHEQRVAPRSYTRSAPPGVGGDQGPGNYWVPVRLAPNPSAPADSAIGLQESVR